MFNVDLEKKYEYENGYYLTSTVDRISKFATHLELFKRSSDLAGEIIECGVFKGVSLSRFIKFRALLENQFSRRIIAFDTFGEFPETKFALDVQKRKEFIEAAGSLSITKERLLSILKTLNLHENIDLIQGDILETVPRFIQNNPSIKISLLHIDVDLYEPTKIVLEYLYPHVVRGGIVILDDYGAFAGANKAIDDYFKNISIKIARLPFSMAISFIEKP